MTEKKRNGNGEAYYKCEVKTYTDERNKYTEYLSLIYFKLQRSFNVFVLNSCLLFSITGVGNISLLLTNFPLNEKPDYSMCFCTAVTKLPEGF
jgi:hypothetical protein